MSPLIGRFTDIKRLYEINSQDLRLKSVAIFRACANL